MHQAVFDAMKDYVGFGAQDAVNVRSLQHYAEPFVPEIVAQFYARILEHRDARAVFTGGPAQIQRQHRVLEEWLRGLFVGNYDDAYFQLRLNIGEAHFRVGLAQRYMIGGIELIWRELETRLRSQEIPNVDARLQSLHKLLMLELGTMLQTYQENYAQRVREMERSAVEEKLTRTQHLAEIGRLAASLAHEIKNPLAGISGAIQVIGGTLPKDTPTGRIIARCSPRSTASTGRSKTCWLRPPASAARTSVRLNELIARVLTVLRERAQDPAYPRGTSAKAPCRRILADERQLEQVVMNLLLNAARRVQRRATRSPS
jgi:two-component system sensor histidine kinase HydH